MSPPSPSFSVYDKIQCINKIAFFRPFLSLHLYLSLVLEFSATCLWSRRRFGAKEFTFRFACIKFLNPHKIPFLSKRKEISTCKIYFISEGRSTMFTFNRNRRLASPHVWKSLKYTGAVRYIFLLQLVNVICQTLSKFEKKKFYLTALICNCLKMQKYSWFCHSVLSQLSENYVDLYNVHLLNRLVEGSALFFLNVTRKWIGWYCFFFSLDEFLCYTL